MKIGVMEFPSLDLPTFQTPPMLDTPGKKRKSAANSEFDVNNEIELMQKAKLGDLRARRDLHRLFNRLLNDLVYKKFMNLPQSVEAIRMEAENLLDAAIDGYNPSMGAKPSTHITNYIEKKIRRYVGDNARPVRMVEKMNIHASKYEQSIQTLKDQYGVHPSDEDVLRHMKKTWGDTPDIANMRLKDVERFKRDMRTTTLSSTTIGGGEGEGSVMTIGDLIYTEGEDDPMESYTNNLKAMELKNKVNMLPEPYRTTIKHTYGIGNHKQLSLRDLALKLGVNKYRIQEYIKQGEGMLSI